MTKLRVLAARTVERKLIRAGFLFKGARGSHQIYQHPVTGRRTSVPIHGGNDIGRALLRTIIKQAGLTIGQFLEI